MDLLEAAWKQREEDVYPDIFDGAGIGIYPLTQEVFEQYFNCQQVDPRWLHYGVFKFPPNDKYPSWRYVSSGMSNPWECKEPQEYSGLGVEFMVEADEDADWPILILFYMTAFNLLLSIGHFGNKPLLDVGDRVSLAIPPNLSHVLFVRPKEYPSSFQLKSGEADLLQVVGITEQEYDLAKEQGSFKLIQRLSSAKLPFSINPDRPSIV